MLDSYGQRYIASLRRTARTKNEYERDLGLFLTWARKRGKQDPCAISSADIEEFLANLKRSDGQPYAAKTRNRILSVLRGLFRFMVKDRLIAALDDPTTLVLAEKLPHRKPLFLEIDEGGAMVVAVRDRFDAQWERVNGRAPRNDEKERQARDLALLALLLGAGLRLSEVVSLNLNTWRQAMMNGWLKVIGKGDKERGVPPSDEALENVEVYLRKWRPDVPPDELGHPLFVSKKKGRLSGAQIERIIKNIAIEAAGRNEMDPEKARLITPHKLRATWVTQLLINGVNPREVQRMAGHESLDTTMIYAGVQDMDDLVRTVKVKQVRYG